MKVLILTKDIKDKKTLDEGLKLAKQYASRIKLPLDFTVRETTKTFTSKQFSNQTNINGYLINDVEIFQEGKKTGVDFDIVCLVHDATSTTPHPTNPAINGLNMQIPLQWYVTYPQVFAQFFLHELSHFFHSDKGVYDRTHEYNQTFVQKPRYEWYLHLIEGLYKPKIERRVTITRRNDGVQVLGHLRAFTGMFHFECETLELPWINNMRNISCIPKGVYEVKYTFSPRFMKSTYQVMNVPGRSGIRIHSANFYYQLNGCIALGDNLVDINGDGKLDVVNSRRTITSFERLMGYQPFVLEIK